MKEKVEKMKELLNLGGFEENTSIRVCRLEEFLRDGDFDSASKLASKLDQMGSVDGTYELSQMYHNGDGVEQDYKKEVDLLWRASIRKHKPSMYNLSLAQNYLYM